MVEFALNSSVNASTGSALFEFNGGYLPRIGQMLEITTYRGVKQFTQQVLWNLMDDTIIESHVSQTHYANQK
ncbi:hypothetical protein K439DRAFT_1374770 [Ramaria rubella]|nr:hypothetical protein K439DRAFT_1374770 [Ramaria rubella]